MTASAAPHERTIRFESPGRFLADLDPETAGRVIAAATDVALVVELGVIKDIALGSEELIGEGYAESWRERSWIETVTTESRAKIEALLRMDPADEARWRQVNHPSSGGIDVPVRYTAVPAGREGRILALGRDLRPISRLQQRLVEAHQSLERDYSRLRRAEARYRLLFECVSQPVLIVDPSTLEIEEINPAASVALGRPAATLTGTTLPEHFSDGSRRLLSKVVAEALSLGRAHARRLRLADGSDCGVAGSSFPEGEGARVILRLEMGTSEARPDPAEETLLKVLEELPDGLIVVGSDLRVVAANPAFVAMTACVHGGQLVGGPLSDFVGRSPTEVNVLVSSLRNHGVVRNFATVVRDRFGNEEPVEISAVALPESEPAAFGFSARGVARRLRAEAHGRERLPRSVDQVTGLVGHLPLREIVRQSTDFIEKLCIEAALEITDDNRASAAEMLGLSRQGLYSKLRRFGVEDAE